MMMMMMIMMMMMMIYRSLSRVYRDASEARNQNDLTMTSQNQKASWFEPKDKEITMKSQMESKMKSPGNHKEITYEITNGTTMRSQ